MTVVAPNLPNHLEALMPRIFARARRLTRDRDAAQDLAQDASLKIWQKLVDDADIQDLEAYAMITLRNLATSGWRQTHASEEIREDHLSCLPEAHARLALKDLMSAINRLPDDQAQLIRLVARGETSPADLANITGIPMGTVMSRLGRARVALRVDLDLSKSSAVSELI